LGIKVAFFRNEELQKGYFMPLFWPVGVFFAQFLAVLRRELFT